MLWRRLSTLLLASFTLLFSVSGNAAATRAEIAWKLIDQGVFLVDVRTPQEYQAGHLEGSVNYPLQVIDRAFQQVPKNTPIVVYCRSGNRSGQAFQYLTQHGYQYVFNGGGLRELQAAKPQ
ncbi:rhodanese-like domain-containing protein [Vibrio sp. JC009]|uniref:rhodanese-like domain-containing protein n=1 Tax=Vibrio sp. JC009 TaxID=2912314 RepID=UPI0023B0E4CE|nr:rhodanese-like domain-containing protein [Vibrio sp. JC009]WED24537.1 rhodanese-like domain-containing protein [Vibrio sp. JC009]